MNMHVTPQHTPAEKALIEGYHARVGDLPGDGMVTIKRDEAIEAIKAGLPTRHVEAWHYTDLRRLLTTVPAAATAGNTSALEPLLAGSTVLHVSGGKTQAFPSAQGLSFMRLSDELVEGRGLAALGPTDAADTIGAINTAFVSDGYGVEIAEGVELSAPLELQNLHNGGQVHTRFGVNVGAGAKAVIVERQTGEASALASAITTLSVRDGAEVMYLIVQEQPKGSSHLGQFRATIGKDAKLTVFIMNAGGKLVRQEIIVDAAGEGCDFQLRGVNLLSGDSHTDVTMVLDHSVPNTGSREVIRNVLTDRAKGVFQGRINVHQIAQKTDAKMACNTLLLSDDADFSAKPELEIFADDVACGHGATVTDINEDHLFYLMARGVPEKAGRGLLVKAFLAEVIEELENEAVIEALEAKLDAWFVLHG
ncbi:Fe-S cluster assembly protein SufD [Tianweitania sp. BSSL-BM11]|uniref:Fe-S cluster assembly protein SufD n=1 Tax=Tianweitania aestuarii TaxID=2814886 RepID=A0ABS5RTD8_9HYPH|nr:Fe-S cluster assembly protein SufD [Tianweitania aestuarii]MBS9720321.1 Fe-S cluster assembly protein SufD [Tianweitania aestuarii]